MKAIVWTLKELVDVINSRQANEFDSNMAVSGERGNGKSTVINKLFYRFKGFRPWKVQVYNRDDVINLLKNQQFGLCWDDEAINSGYKRNFMEKGQQELIKIITAYRDNYNIYASAIPNFFSLDKDLRDLYFIHLHIIERGIAVIHMPLQGRLYSPDKWDAKYNAKIEDSWSKKMQKNPDFKPPYHRLSTFRGYLFFSDATEKQKKLYKEIKKEKRKTAFLTEGENNKELPFIQKLYNLLLEGKLTREGIAQASLVEGKKDSATYELLGRRLKDNGVHKTVKDLLCESRNKSASEEVRRQVHKIVSY